MASPNKSTGLLDDPAPLCECCNRREHSHIPNHPASWRRDASSSVFPGASHTSAQFTHPDGVTFHWNSRAHRKGRVPRLRNADGTRVEFHRPPTVLLNLDVRNISWWLGFVFTVASTVWVVNGVYAFSPDLSPERAKSITGVTALIGGSLFIIGGYLAVLESLNAKDEIPSSYVAASSDADKEGGRWELRFRAPPGKSMSPDGRDSKQKFRFWGWMPRSMGYVSNLLVFIGTLIFYIPCVASYPPIDDALSTTAQNVLVWLPQVVASVLFIIGPTIGMLEVQSKWIQVMPFNLGWEAAFWNFVGGWGFLLSGAFGFVLENPGVAHWGVQFSTLWGSVAFLIGSMCQWVECMNPH